MTLRLIALKLGSAARLFLVFTLILAISPAMPLVAQVAAVSQSVSTTPMALHITILEGEDALNSIRERTAREPIVQVEDENHKPVAGALVLFSIQNGSSGAGGSFNGLTSLSVTTDSTGRAVGHGLVPNATTGSYTISVTATLGSLVATAVIAQSNVASLASASAASSTAAGTTAKRNIFRFSHIPKKVWITGGAVVTTAVVVGVVVATRGNSSTSVTAGTGTVGPP
jgi:hypothetical protein